MSVCRHCASPAFDARSYASVLVAGGAKELQSIITDLESRIVPCVTAVCPECQRVSVLSDGSTESLLCTIFMWRQLREWIDPS
jgi:hypothetical protein